MKNLLHQYVAYNAWANEKICESVIVLSQDQLHLALKSSFDSIYKTVLHVYGATFLWRKRLNREENLQLPIDVFEGDAKLLTQAWMDEDQQWLIMVGKLEPDRLSEILTYKNLKGETFRLPVYQIIQHVVNHGTYHRGQLVTLLREVGVNKIPATDFSLWAWNSFLS